MTAPDGPTDLKRDSWTAALKRTWSEFREDNMTDWAAALTYYSVLAIFPALLAVVSVLGLIGPSATQPLIDNINTLAPGPAKDLLVSAIRNIQHSSGAAGVLFVVSIALAIWSASGYVAAFMRASNVIYDVGEGRPIWKTLPTRVAHDPRAARHARGRRRRRDRHRQRRALGRRRRSASATPR